MAGSSDPEDARDLGGWREIEARNTEGGTIRLLTIRAPGAPSAEGDIRWVVLREPRVVRRESGAPGLSLTLVLDRQPDPSDTDLAARVRHGTLSLEVTTVPSPEVVASLPSDDTEYRPIFPQSVVFALVRDTNEERLAQTEVTGGGATGALSVTVDREDALRLLDAARGNATGLAVVADLRYRVPSSNGLPDRITLRCDLADVHRVLDRGTGDDRILYRADLENYLALMLGEGIIELDAETDDLTGSDVPVFRALDPFVRAASFILERLEDDERSDRLGGRYELGGAPHGSFEIRFTASLSGGSSETDSLRLEVSLEDLIEEATGDGPADAWLNMVATTGTGETEPLRRLDDQRGASRSRGLSDRVRLARVGDKLSSVSTALRPSPLAAPAHVMLAAQPVDRLNLDVLADHLTFVGQDDDPPAHLPVVKDLAAPLWPDRTDDGRRWYAPEFHLQTDPTAALDRSPFAFSFETQGHGVGGEAGIDAEIRFTIEERMSAATRRAVDDAGEVDVEAVPLDNLSIALSIPFREQGSGRTRTELVRATSVERGSGTITAVLRLQDQWARLAYGALAYEGFQSQPAELSIAYRFQAYAPLEKDRRVEVAHGTKRVRIPLAGPDGEPARASRGVGDADSDTLELPDGVVRFQPSRARSRPRPDLSAISVTRPQTVHVAPALTIRPEVLSGLTIADPQRFRSYVVGERIKEARLEALFPCGPHGSHYVEVLNGEATPIGCRETFRLGQGDPRLYERISLPGEFGRCRVHRSLQTPGLFVVVPREYAITRYDTDEGERAFRPTLLLYSSIDVEDLGASRCMYSCSLQPDLAPFFRAKLADHLRAHHHPSPIVEYFTALPGEIDVEWALPTGTGSQLETEIETVRSWDGFEVTLATDALGVPQINSILGTSGVTGTATLALSDGSSLWTSLRLDLRRVVGPWATGPLETRSDDGTITMENRIESPVAVSEILLLGEDGSVLGTVPVEQTIQPGTTLEVEVGENAGEPMPIYSIQSTSTSLVEIRSYIEDISISLILLNRLDYAASGVSKIQVKARLQGRSGERTVEFTPQSGLTQGIEFLLPLTEYIDDPVVEITPSYLEEGGWTDVDPLEWHPTRDGVMVHVDAGLLGIEAEE